MGRDATWAGSMPETYDRCLGPLLFAPYAEALAARVAAARPPRVLELAAGTGIVTAALLRALPGAAVLATDLNPAMVDWGSRQVPGATWRVADVQRLEEDLAGEPGTADGAAGAAPVGFDAVACGFGVMFLPDRPAAYAQVGRVLRPGGTLHLSTWDELRANALPAAFTDALAAVLEGPPPPFLERVPHGHHDPDAIRADLRAGGLDPVAVERVVLPGRAPSARVVAEGFCLGTPVRFALRERGDPVTFAAAVGAELERRLGAGPVEGPLSAWLVTARAG